MDESKKQNISYSNKKKERNSNVSNVSNASSQYNTPVSSHNSSNNSSNNPSPIDSRENSPKLSPKLSPKVCSIQENNNVIFPSLNEETKRILRNNENYENGNESNESNQRNERDERDESNEPVINSSMIRSIDLSMDDVILNLKIISKVKPGYKLSIKQTDNGYSVYIDTTYLQYFYRMWSDNSREYTLTFLETLDKDITKKIEELVSENSSKLFLNSKENILLNLSHNLNLSLVGLNNLINTYSNDEYTVSKLEMIISNFELKVRKISNILKVD